MANRKLTQERLKELVSYDPETGKFTWIRREGHSASVRRWNARWAGREAGSHHCRGYMRICIDSVDYKAHHLVWLYVYGTFPSCIIDHENRDASDNRIANLRLATASQNGANKGVSRANRSGAKGVCWHATLRKWQAEIRVNGRKVYLGVFSEIDAARAAYEAAANLYFGQFAASD